MGTDDDPCFGKLHDLSADECRRCGDSTLCSIVFNQITEAMRKKEEKNGRFKDLELVSNDKAKQFIKKKLDKGVNSLRITKLIMSKFTMDKASAKELIKSVKDE